tara:strand:+ start:274 stop:432 length:159 start_codon:yes stop_codon:yes gene_type:complete
MEPNNLFNDFASIAVTILALFSFYLMIKKQGRNIDVVLGFILAIFIVLKLIN